MTVADRELSAGTPVPPGVISTFLYQEARLADEGRYVEWLALWAPGEVLYWVAPRADVDPLHEVSYVYDNRERLEQRVARWDSGFAWAQVPRSETHRIVGNVEILSDGAPTNERVTAVEAVGHLCVARKGTVSLVSQRLSYRLCMVDGMVRMLEKKVVLLGGEAPVGNISFIL